MYSVEWEQRSEKSVHIDLDPAMGRILSYKHTLVTLIIVKKSLICGYHFLRRWKQTNRLRDLNHSLWTTEALPRSLWPSKLMFFYNTFFSPPFSKLAMTPNVIVFISRAPQPLQMAEPLAAFLEDSQGLKQHDVFEVPLQPLLCSFPLPLKLIYQPSQMHHLSQGPGRKETKTQMGLVSRVLFGEHYMGMAAIRETSKWWWLTPWLATAGSSHCCPRTAVALEEEYSHCCLRAWQGWSWGIKWWHPLHQSKTNTSERQ